MGTRQSLDFEAALNLKRQPLVTVYDASVLTKADSIAGELNDS